MNKEELRGFDTALNDIKNMEEGKIYPLDLFDSKIYRRQLYVRIKDNKDDLER